jgi:S1-C subfamily serine protease
MTPALREHFGAPRDAGVLVLGVRGAEGAPTAGLQVGDVLVQLGGRGIRGEDQLEWTLSTWPQNRPLVARVIRGGQSLVVDLGPVAAALPAPGPELERSLLERQIRSEIGRLEERIRELREELERLHKQR